MKLPRAPRAAVLLALAVLVGSAGALYAECAVACPFGEGAAVHPCCRPGAAPAMRGASCCETLEAAAPVPASRAVAPAPAVSLAPSAPVALPIEPAASDPPAALPDPPPLHEGIGLYTLHAAFLI
jgi:hypothetical protein